MRPKQRPFPYTLLAPEARHGSRNAACSKRARKESGHNNSYNNAVINSSSKSNNMER